MLFESGSNCALVSEGINRLAQAEASPEPIPGLLALAVITFLGSYQSFFWPLAGAIGFKILETVIARQWPIYWPLFLGAAVIIVIIALPQGFVGLIGRRAWRTTTTAR